MTPWAPDCVMLPTAHRHGIVGTLFYLDHFTTASIQQDMLSLQDTDQWNTTHFYYVKRVKTCPEQLTAHQTEEWKWTRLQFGFHFQRVFIQGPIQKVTSTSHVRVQPFTHDVHVFLFPWQTGCLMNNPSSHMVTSLFFICGHILFTHSRRGKVCEHFWNFVVFNMNWS